MGPTPCGEQIYVCMVWFFPIFFAYLLLLALLPIVFFFLGWLSCVWLGSHFPVEVSVIFFFLIWLWNFYPKKISGFETWCLGQYCSKTWLIWPEVQTQKIYCLRLPVVKGKLLYLFMSQKFYIKGKKKTEYGHTWFSKQSLK